MLENYMDLIDLNLVKVLQILVRLDIYNILKMYLRKMLVYQYI